MITKSSVGGCDAKLCQDGQGMGLGHGRRADIAGSEQQRQGSPCPNHRWVFRLHNLRQEAVLRCPVDPVAECTDCAAPESAAAAKSSKHYCRHTDPRLSMRIFYTPTQKKMMGIPLLAQLVVLLVSFLVAPTSGNNDSSSPTVVLAAYLPEYRCVSTFNSERITD